MSMSSSTAGTLSARDKDVIGATEMLRFFPLEIESASGAIITPVGGGTLIDLSGAWGAATVGYAHPRVVRAVSTEVARMPGAGILSGTNETTVSLAERLIELVPSRGERRAVHLGLAGSDANSAALRAVRAWSDRPGILAFEGSYHGGLGPAQHVSGFHASSAVPLDPGVDTVPYPDTGHAVEAINTGRYAAVIVEPIMADGGLVIPPSDFLPALRQACDQTGTLLIADEVKVGSGRTGWLLASSADGVESDIATMGKGLGGGLPLSAVVAPQEILAAAPGSSLLTLAGNPVSAAAGHAVLDALTCDDLLNRTRQAGEQLKPLLQGLAQSSPLVNDVRSRGLVAGIELTSEDGSPAGSEAAAAVYLAHQRYSEGTGAVAYCVGPEANVIELTPPLVISEEQLRHALDILGQALQDVAEGKVDWEELSQYGGW